MKWVIKLNVFALKYVPLKAIKGQVKADFLAQHPCINVTDPLAEPILCINLKPWVLMFDGSKTKKGAGAGIAITSLDGRC